MPRFPTVAIILLLVLIAFVSIAYNFISKEGGGTHGTTSSIGITSTILINQTSTSTILPANNTRILCAQNDPKVSDPTAPHGLYVLYPYADYNNQQYKSAIAKYLMTNNSFVCGAVFYVKWADVDKGPGANPQYNFSLIDGQIQPWINAGKIVNLDVWGVGYTAGTSGTTPQYVVTV